MKDKLCLPLAEGHPADRGLNIARIKYKNMAEVGVNSLDCLKIFDPKTGASVYATALALMDNIHDDVLRLDANKSAKLGSGMGSKVEISKYDTRRANEIWIVGDFDIYEREIKDFVSHRTHVSTGDKMTKLYGGKLYNLTIEAYLPADDAVEVTRKTVFHVNEKVALNPKPASL